MNKNTVSVAVDGPSGAGKSTLSKAIARNFNFIYVDTGAIYRTVGLYCVRNGISCKDEDSVKETYPNIKIEIEYDDTGLQQMILNGENVTDDIRKPEISIAASDVSAHPSCRAFLLEMQRKFANDYNVIMDGRDIGTVVLPDADVKIFLTASSSVRAQRRLAELKAKGIDTSFEDVLKDIEYRDYQDSHRDVAPLKKAEDAIEFDTSNGSFDENLDMLCSIIADKLI